MNVLALTPTYGRHYYVERSLRMFLEQDYENKTMVIYQNCVEKPQKLASEVPSNVVLINEKEKIFPGLPELYTHLFTLIQTPGVLPVTPDLVIFWDDDDIYLPNHISSHVEGYKACGKKAYKVTKSYFRSGTEVSIGSNVCEPGWLLDFNFVKECGFLNQPDGKHHHNWVNRAIGEKSVCFGENVPLTFCYTWGNPEMPVFKHSGNAGNSNNMNAYRAFNNDHGDFVITPSDKNNLYDLFNQIRSVQP